MQCAYHPDREPAGACVACGKLICVECKALLGGKMYCSPCADKIFVQGKGETPSTGKTQSVAARQQPKADTQPAYVVINKSEPSVPAGSISNNSGQGSASVLPVELKGWNWGAFFLNWIWGIGNNVWIALLTFVLGFIWAIVLGAKGSEWAWQHKKWDSIEHFKKTQRTWRKWGIWLFIASIIIGVIYIIFIIVVVATSGIKNIRF